MRSPFDSFLEPFGRPRHRFHLDDKSDGFGKLLLDMIKRDLGPLFMTGSARPAWGILLLPTRFPVAAKSSDRLVLPDETRLSCGDRG